VPDFSYQFADVELDPNARFAATVRLPADSLWFDGHFPGDPVLPGAALLAMAKDAATRASAGRHLPSAFEFRRVKFKAALRPGDVFRVTVNCRTQGAQRIGAFRFDRRDEVVAEGELSWDAAHE
jgi:3-hydroxymyristoyl/3-hydroxydecanoyl-(acyl carrier protein) dehydratase